MYNIFIPDVEEEEEEEFFIPEDDGISQGFSGVEVEPVAGSPAPAPQPLQEEETTLRGFIDSLNERDRAQQPERQFRNIFGLEDEALEETEEVPEIDTTFIPEPEVAGTTQVDDRYLETQRNTPEQIEKRERERQRQEQRIAREKFLSYEPRSEEQIRENIIERNPDIEEEDLTQRIATIKDLESKLANDFREMRRNDRSIENQERLITAVHSVGQGNPGYVLASNIIFGDDMERVEEVASRHQGVALAGNLAGMFGGGLGAGALSARAINIAGRPLLTGVSRAMATGGTFYLTTRGTNRLFEEGRKPEDEQDWAGTIGEVAAITAINAVANIPSAMTSHYLPTARILTSRMALNATIDGVSNVVAEYAESIIEGTEFTRERAEATFLMGVGFQVGGDAMGIRRANLDTRRRASNLEDTRLRYRGQTDNFDPTGMVSEIDRVNLDNVLFGDKVDFIGTSLSDKQMYRILFPNAKEKSMEQNGEIKRLTKNVMDKVNSYKKEKTVESRNELRASIGQLKEVQDIYRQRARTILDGVEDVSHLMQEQPLIQVKSDVTEQAIAISDYIRNNNMAIKSAADFEQTFMLAEASIDGTPNLNMQQVKQETLFNMAYGNIPNLPKGIKESLQDNAMRYLIARGNSNNNPIFNVVERALRTHTADPIFMSPVNESYDTRMVRNLQHFLRATSARPATFNPFMAKLTDYLYTRSIKEITGADFFGGSSPLSSKFDLDQMNSMMNHYAHKVKLDTYMTVEQLREYNITGKMKQIIAQDERLAGADLELVTEQITSMVDNNMGVSTSELEVFFTNALAHRGDRLSIELGYDMGDALGTFLPIDNDIHVSNDPVIPTETEGVFRPLDNEQRRTVISHELGHFIDISSTGGQVLQLLKNNGLNLGDIVSYSSAINNMSIRDYMNYLLRYEPKDRSAEIVADFLNVYTIAPQVMQEKSPNLYNFLQSQRTGLLGELNQLHGMTATERLAMVRKAMYDGIADVNANALERYLANRAEFSGLATDVRDTRVQNDFYKATIIDKIYSSIVKYLQRNDGVRRSFNNMRGAEARERDYILSRKDDAKKISENMIENLRQMSESNLYTLHNLVGDDYTLDALNNYRSQVFILDQIATRPVGEDIPNTHFITKQEAINQLNAMRDDNPTLVKLIQEFHRDLVRQGFEIHKQGRGQYSMKQFELLSQNEFYTTFMPGSKLGTVSIKNGAVLYDLPIMATRVGSTEDLYDPVASYIIKMGQITKSTNVNIAKEYVINKLLQRNSKDLVGRREVSWNDDGEVQLSDIHSFENGRWIKRMPKNVAMELGTIRVVEDGRVIEYIVKNDIALAFSQGTKSNSVIEAMSKPVYWSKILFSPGWRLTNKMRDIRRVSDNIYNVQGSARLAGLISIGDIKVIAENIRLAVNKGAKEELLAELNKLGLMNYARTLPTAEGVIRMTREMLDNPELPASVREKIVSYAIIENQFLESFRPEVTRRKIDVVVADAIAKAEAEGRMLSENDIQRISDNVVAERSELQDVASTPLNRLRHWTRQAQANRERTLTRDENFSNAVALSLVKRKFQNQNETPAMNRLKEKHNYSDNEVADFIRRYTNTPFSVSAGTNTDLLGAVFPFYKAQVSALVNDLNLRYNPSVNPDGIAGVAGYAGGVVFSALTAVLMEYGLTIGENGLEFNEDLMNAMQTISPFKRNYYGIIPIGTQKNGRVLYAQLPIDDTNRPISILLKEAFRKVMGRSKIDGSIDLSNWFNEAVMTGVDMFLPTLNPVLTTIPRVIQILGGGNPISEYGYPVFTQSEQENMNYFLPAHDIIPEVKNYSTIEYKYHPSRMTLALEELWNMGMGGTLTFNQRNFDREIQAGFDFDEGAMNNLGNTIRLANITPYFRNMIGRFFNITDKSIIETEIDNAYSPIKDMNRLKRRVIYRETTR